MSQWSKITRSITNFIGAKGSDGAAKNRDSNHYAFIDIEVSENDKRIHDIGALRHDGATFHSANKRDLFYFLQDEDYLCGHNIINHDAKYLLGEEKHKWVLVDTLYLSPLLFPERPYHRLVKDDKLISEQLNNPVNDCKKAHELLMDEIDCWKRLSMSKQRIYASLLKGIKEFDGFLKMVNAESFKAEILVGEIRSEYNGKICHNVDIEGIIAQHPCELAYSLALIGTTDHHSATPPWVLHTFPGVENVIRLLRHNRCSSGCDYCNRELNIKNKLRDFFSYDEFRTYDSEPLQENAVQAATDGESLLAIFPTGGGKSLTFQLPALMEGHSVHGLTVVISPLQSLMKDQVDNLNEKGITDAITINGLLDPLSRSTAIQNVENGNASLLYISPEMLRSNTIEKILLARNVVRFVIDEAHCFSSWGQDFRIDYLYIGTFIREYQKKKRLKTPIPVSCFTATAKQKVIQDICDYFKKELNLDLKIFASSAARTNLRYSVIHADTNEEKYIKLRTLISESTCPTIVYVSRTTLTMKIAERLTKDGFEALPYNGKMDADDKIKNQNDFMNDKVRIIVATSAFGMGVDKKDVGLVIHYDISDSLENYVQEAGRAGRDPKLEARCIVLYNDSDLNKHFFLLNQTKLSISEIQQVWQAVKKMTSQRRHVSCSALEIARNAGWDDHIFDIETRVRTALASLEQSGYIKRGNNTPHIFATGIKVNNVEEARKRIFSSLLFENDEQEKALQIIKSLISQKYISKAHNAEAETRVDYLADRLGMTKNEVISIVERMRLEGILADSKDITVFLKDTKDPQKTLNRFFNLESHLLKTLTDDALKTSYKQLNDDAHNNGISTSTEKDIRTILNFLSIRGYISVNKRAEDYIEIFRKSNTETMLSLLERRYYICEFALKWLTTLSLNSPADMVNKNGIQFSIVALLNDIKTKGNSLLCNLNTLLLPDIEEALLYLSKIGALKLEGGFMVIYNTMNIDRIKDNKLRYKQDDYLNLNEFYKQKIQQIHIVGEFANLMVRDYNAALQYVQDYFLMDYRKFISKYFKGDRAKEINVNLTQNKYNELFGCLSSKQKEIISDKDSRHIVVAAGPGSGKTRVLVHKLASLLLLEDVKHEQLLMLTFSRAAATEFKQRLTQLIGNAAHFVDIKTFHSYCFELLGRIGNLDDSDEVVVKATQMINNHEVEPNRIRKTVLVIDEAQDMSGDEYELVKALMNANEDMRVIAVGDDDQNIFEFRGSDSKYMRELTKDSDARLIEMTENYRSSKHIVDFANAFATNIQDRMKSNPIISMSKDDGFVSITQHKSEHLYEPLINDLLFYHRQGSICILTQTNEEAATIVALLRKRGLKSKLIQSTDKTKLFNIVEVRMFFKHIKQNTKSQIITDIVWNNAINITSNKYKNSTALPYLQRCIKTFEETNKVKYLNDLKEFLFESTIDDFCDVSEADVVVSTIHKSKGREFDNVFMLINKKAIAGKKEKITDKELHLYYVGMTRAKKSLFIHTNCTLFNNMKMKADKYYFNRKQYSMPDEITLQLSYHDVFLDFFKSIKKEILSLNAGDKLRYKNNILSDIKTDKEVCKLSFAMQDYLSDLAAKGYYVSDASIRFVVSWRPKQNNERKTDYAVLLVDLSLKREQKTGQSDTTGIS
ncbi:MAG: RecQ family ATP-dependent DNA helicase [Candidatus Limimorpha sp.]